MSDLPVTESSATLQMNFDAINRVIEKIHLVVGTPEGIVVAPVGHIALRSDGGAGTTLYVKESGIGATGWVPK